VEEAELEEFLATVTAVPENGDPGLVRELSELLPSRELALGTVEVLLRKMARIVAANDGWVVHVEDHGARQGATAASRT
jgi:hypothetical protein